MVLMYTNPIQLCLIQNLSPKKYQQSSIYDLQRNEMNMYIEVLLYDKVFMSWSQFANFFSSFGY